MTTESPWRRQLRETLGHDDKAALDLQETGDRALLNHHAARVLRGRGGGGSIVSRNHVGPFDHLLHDALLDGVLLERLGFSHLLDFYAELLGR